MHSGVLVGVVGETCEAAVLVVGGGVVVLEPDAFGDSGFEGCCDAHAATPTQLITRMAINRIAVDMRALSQRVSVSLVRVEN
jgi:hypothetical protein